MLYRAKQDGPVVLVKITVSLIVNYISTYYWLKSLNFLAEVLEDIYVIGQSLERFKIICCF